jgi:hypothetical protein
MQIAQISSIQETGSFVCKAGPQAGKTMYSFMVTFSDGTMGGANAMNQKPAWAEGDTVGYDISGKDNRGQNKLKIDRKAAQQIGITQTPSQAAAQAPLQANMGHSPAIPGIHPATAGCAFKASVEVLGKPTPLAIEDGSYAKAVWELASQFVRVLYKLETGKLAPKIGTAVTDALKEAGFTPPKPVASPESDDPY